jgi:hypothetical protein
MLDPNAIAAELESCRCREPQMQDALDDAGETIARLGNEADLHLRVAEALADCLRQEHQRAEGLRLELEVAQREAAGVL